MGKPHTIKDHVKAETAPINDCVDGKPQHIELLNFGQSPLETIEKFQEFCKSHTSLAEAIIFLLKRESLLTRKYKFIISPVSYQMLVRPTRNDPPEKLSDAIRSLQRFTRRGRYDTVANAVEELLFSPSSVSPLKPQCDKATWTEGNVGTQYTELSYNQQVVLEQIASALLHKLNHSPTAKKRKSTKGSEGPTKKKVRTQSVDSCNSHFNPIKPEPKSPSLMKRSRNLNPSTAIDESKTQEIVDEMVAIPIKNFLLSKKSRKSLKPDITPFMLGRKSPTKTQFLRAFFRLLPVLKR